MPLTGEYEPSTSERTRRQVELFERSDGAEGNTLRGMPVIVLTSVGAKSGKLRKNAVYNAWGAANNRTRSSAPARS